MQPPSLATCKKFCWEWLGLLQVGPIAAAQIVGATIHNCSSFTVGGKGPFRSLNTRCPKMRPESLRNISVHNAVNTKPSKRSDCRVWFLKHPFPSFLWPRFSGAAFSQPSQQLCSRSVTAPGESLHQAEQCDCS